MLGLHGGKAGHPVFVIFRNWFIIRLNATEKQQ